VVKKVFGYKYSLITSLLLAIFYSNVYALQGSTAENGSNAQAVHDINITGAGIKIGLVSGGNVRADHEAFGGNVTNSTFHPSLPVTVTWHETWVAGIAISRGGAAHPYDIGVAPGASIYSGLVANNKEYIEDALDWMIVSNQCRVIMSGFQEPYDPCDDSDPYYPDGTSDLSLMYDYYANSYDVVFANAAGNYIYDPCTGITTRRITVLGDAYNGITTAGLGIVEQDNYRKIGSVSNYGPTVDGRNKPDIAGPSNNQTVPTSSSPTAWSSTPSNNDGATSFSTPHTAGVAALLLQYADSTTAEIDDAHNEVIKAVIVNSAYPNILSKSGGFTDPANQVWHPHRGYGRIDAYRAYLTLSAGKVAAGTPINSTAGWAYNTLGDSQTHIYFINAQHRERLVLTVTWNRAVTREWQSKPWELYWKYYDEGTQRFNIDITVKDPCNTVVYSENDANNNLIKIDIPLELTGEYEITLTNTTSKTRDYGLAFELLSPLTGDFNVDYVVDELDLNQMALDWLTAEPETDIVPDIPDGIVNFLDFTVFADNWLKIDSRYYNP
jgi:hypothetical protein